MPLSKLLLIALNVAAISFAFASGIVSNLLGYYVWHWEAKSFYELLMITVPVINIIYLLFIANDSSLIALWVKRKRLEEQQRISDLQRKN
ncbi:hypothetical protein KC222_04140 [Cedecea davisae]|uniref:Uncharacterized protein n=1 Tax=Cedecea davisae TaxID=158484 RepID=A0ABS6DDE0_9ENTR|nr:hypothetical protein [Cedecea davisae]MBU4681201.1 hypothetical protein [Cedecea davisae]MBU4685066.1 hypothetical protein [Cedecea davisae]